ncbi:MAG: CCA tRNA nucleotidyltransferase [Lachnospiraceae bacterium]
MEIKLPEKVNHIIKTIQAAGYEAYAVGGCIRDSILGRMPEDWDITTSAMPMQVKELFYRTFDTGIEHGTVTVVLEKESFEVTTYRIDGEYEDNRHPKEVTFTRNLMEDLLRRDFTMNAMAYNEETGLVDGFSGRKDLENQVIRCVGNAAERFGEDALRMLRGVRFAAQLGFTMESETKVAIQALAPTLSCISAERIQMELIKMLVSPRPEMLEMAYELGITKVILPEFDDMMETEQETKHHQYNVGEHTLESMKAISADKVLRLTMLLHDVGKPVMKTVDSFGVAHFKGHDLKSEELAKRILRRLKMDNDTTEKVCHLVRYHDYRMPAKPVYVRRAMNKIGKELFPAYLEVRKADLAAQSDYLRKEKEENIRGVEACYLEILEKQQCVSLKELAVSGRDLIEVGMSPGAKLGEMLQQLLEKVIEEPDRNQKEALLNDVRSHLQNH